MKIVVLYATQSGNTEKVALKMKQTLQCDIKNVTQVMKESPNDFWGLYPADLYLIGTGIYAGKVHTALHDFLVSHPPPEKARLALFATWIGRGNSGEDALTKLQRFIEKQKAIVIPPYFLCYGKIALFRLNHPDEADLKNAAAWTLSVSNQIQ